MPEIRTGQRPSIALPDHGAPWCSVVIPTLNEEGTLPRLLSRLHPHLATGDIEVIVADGGSCDGTVALARSFGCVTLPCTRGRAQQMNAGARFAQAPHLWFLHADTLPPPDWPRQLRAAAGKGDAATFPLQFDYRKVYSPLRLYGWLSGINWNAFRFGDQSLFVSSEVFHGIGGFNEAMELLEDNDIVRRLHRATGKIRLLDGHVLTSARKYREYGVIYTQLVYVILYGAYRLGAGNDRLLRWYRRAFRHENRRDA